MNQEVLALLDSLRDNEGHLSTWDLPEEFEMVEEGDWVQEHKFQYSECIVNHKPTNTYWSLGSSRSGSYHTDWYYDATQIDQVERHEEVVTKTVVTWRNVE